MDADKIFVGQRVRYVRSDDPLDLLAGDVGTVTRTDEVDYDEVGVFWDGYGRMSSVEPGDIEPLERA